MLDSSAAPTRRPTSRRRPARPRPEPGPGSFRGPHATAGPYSADDGRFEVRLERVPGGLRLAAWMAGSIRRAAPVLAASDLPGLLQRAVEAGVLEEGSQLLEALRAPAGSGSGHGASPGRAGELREELRVEAVGDGRVRLARWLLRPGRGWELQQAPVMLPAERYAEALERAAAAGVLASG